MNVGAKITAIAGLALMLTLLAPVEPALAAPQQSSSSSAQSQQQTPPAAPSAQSTASAQLPASAKSAANVDDLPVSLDRIREQLAREPAFSLNLLRALDIPVFRVEQRSDLVFRPDPNYWKDNDVGNDVRPTVNKWHYDFMKMTNPNLPTGYGPGGGIDVLSGIQAAFSGIHHAMQARERAQVRQQIREELRQINEERRRAGLPPIDESTVIPTQTASPDQTSPSSAPHTSIKATAPPQ